MKKGIALAFISAISFVGTNAQTVKGPLGEVFEVRVVKDKLSDPWEITYGPDNYLWVTEAKGYTISRINPTTGQKSVLLNLSPERKFPRYDKIPDEQDGGKPWPQGGLMGLALHPKLLDGMPYVYVSYIYQFAGANSDSNGNAPNFGGNFFTARIARYEYNGANQTLSNPIILCDSIPGSNDHNSGRLLIAPVGGKNYLFNSVGDMGAGQFDNGGRTNYSQQVDKYEGKVLRFNLEPDTDLGLFEKWIPNDNPFNDTKQNAVWSFGHRNAQGLAYAVVGGTGRIYSSEHGPYGDDEINIIERAKNYGHPLVIGYNDNNYNGFAASVSDHQSLPGKWHTSYPLIISESKNIASIGPTNYRDPIKSFNPIHPDTLAKIFDSTIKGAQNRPDWKAEAPSSIEVYTSAKIPGWKNSLLVPTLKEGKLIRLKLSQSGTAITGDTINYFKGRVRYRDIALSPDGTKIYLATDSSTVTSGPSEENEKGISYKGCIIELKYRSAATSNLNNKTEQKGKRGKVKSAARNKTSELGENSGHQ